MPSFLQYTYDLSATPRLLALSSTVSGPLGGSILTLTGTAFGIKVVGSQSQRVYVGSKVCEHSTWTANEIVCTLPPNSNGFQKIKIQLADESLAGLRTFAIFVCLLFHCDMFQCPFCRLMSFWSMPGDHLHLQGDRSQLHGWISPWRH